MGPPQGLDDDRIEPGLPETADRRVEEAERRALEAEHRLREQSLRVAEAEHKFKTDLTVIIGWSNLLMDMGSGAEETRTGLQAIRRSAERMAGEAERHLAELRAELSTEGLVPQDLDLSEILRYTVGDWSARPDHPVGFAGDDAVRVWADPGALQQVLGHLIDNAIRHSPAGTRVTVSCHSRPDDMTEIEVADDGPGIPDDVDIFAPFVQAGESVRSEGGIGLFVVRRLVMAMEGSVSAERRPTGGSTFMVRLPAAARIGRPAPVRVDLTEEIVTHSGMPCILVEEGRIAYANPATLALVGTAWPDMRGLRLSELAGQGWAELAAAVDDLAAHRPDPSAIDLGTPGSRTIRRTVNITIDPETPARRFECAIHPGQANSVVIWMLDTSTALAFGGRGAITVATDSITGLPDRRLALDRLAQALTRARRSSPSVGVFVIDIANLDHLNRTEGSAVRDGVLAGAARALGRVVRPGDMVARLDEARLLIVCENLNGHRAMEAVRGRVEAAVSGPAIVDGVMYSVEAIVGAAIASAQAAAGAGPEALIEQASQEGRSECTLA